MPPSERQLISHGLHQLLPEGEKDLDYHAFDKSTNLLKFGDKAHKMVCKVGKDGDLCFLSVKKTQPQDGREVQERAEIGTEVKAGSPARTSPSGSSSSWHPALGKRREPAAPSETQFSKRRREDRITGEVSEIPSLDESDFQLGRMHGGRAKTVPSIKKTKHKTVKLLFDDTVTEDLRGLFSGMMKGMRKFPKDKYKVVIEIVSEIEKRNATNGLTTWLDTEKKTKNGSSDIVITLRVDPNKPKTPEYLGQLAYTFAHEMGVHALHYSVCASRHNFASKPIVALPVPTQHKKIFYPSDETNPWHRMLKENILVHVPPELRVPFLREYALDIEDSCARDFGGDDRDGRRYEYARGDGDLYDKGMAWAEKIKEKAESPDDPFWIVEQQDGTIMPAEQHQAPSVHELVEIYRQRRMVESMETINPTMSDASSVEDESSAGGDINYMEHTVEDLQDAIEYEETIQAREGDPNFDSSSDESSGLSHQNP